MKGYNQSSITKNELKLDKTGEESEFSEELSKRDNSSENIKNRNVYKVMNKIFALGNYFKRSISRFTNTLIIVVLTLFVSSHSVMGSNLLDKDTIYLGPTNNVGLFYAQVLNGIMDINPVPGYVLQISVTMLEPDATLYLWMHDDVFFFHRTAETLPPEQIIPLYSGMSKVVVLGGAAVYEIIVESSTSLPLISHSMLHHASTMFYDMTGILRSVGIPSNLPKGTYICRSKYFPTALYRN